MTTYHFIIKGRVQGVGFRFFIHDLAKRYNINGRVRNLYNGDVEVIAQGDLKNINSFKKELKKGPLLGRIDSIEETMEDLKEYEAFEIKY